MGPNVIISSVPLNQELLSMVKSKMAQVTNLVILSSTWLIAMVMLVSHPQLLTSMPSYNFNSKSHLS